MDQDEPVTIGLSSTAHGKLQRLKDDGYFAELMDAYRFAVALALAHASITPSVTNRTTIFNIGSFDPDKSMYYAVLALRTNTGEPVYRTMERLAEWGVEEMARRAEEGRFSVLEILREAVEAR